MTVESPCCTKSETVSIMLYVNYSSIQRILALGNKMFHPIGNGQLSWRSNQEMPAVPSRNSPGGGAKALGLERAALV